MGTVLIVAVVSIVMLVGLFIGFQVFMIRKMQGQRGKPAPALEGKAGKAIARGKASLFYFYSPQCGACRPMTPVVKSMAKKQSSVFPVDISRDMATARKFGVMATPTTILVKDGTVAEVLIGPQPESVLRGLV